MTDKGYDQLGTMSKLAVAFGLYSGASSELKNIPVNEFAGKANAGLKLIQARSGANTIVSGNGGQIQLTGFYRQSDKDTIYTTSEADRATDSLNNVDVTYYVYTDGADSGVTVTTPVASNGKNLYSPNESVFKFETTRPYFTNFGDIITDLSSSEVVADFENTLGTSSYDVTDGQWCKH